MKLHLPALPFSQSALEPHISRETIEYHYGKHHSAYVEKTNELAKSFDGSLEDLVRSAEHGPLFNNAAQAWNHTFYWQCLSAEKTKPSGALAGAINDAFGGMEGFGEEFAKRAAANFGSGWTWLVRDEKGFLKIADTSNAETPITNGTMPLLVADVWEHAYYIDYRNERPKHLEALTKILNWKFASERFDDAGIFQATPLMREKKAA